ncbi:acyl-CoA synthetase FdrA [Actinomycetaceae bacterium TAE3-ERU4]|nr:acyl-CoA synthetase FdrA [Actinomycetaceae bacterium TAE3-ERU4]
MKIKAIVKPNAYADSMVLMALSTKVNELPMVEKAMVGMGTNLNKQVISEVGLSTPEIEKATPRDQIIVVKCETDELCDQALEMVEELRNQGPVSDAETTYATAHAAFDADEDSSLVVISVPGEYAAAEAKKALEAGKNVMLFSDNVTVEDELDLKTYAHENDLLVMGPDCGTAIINGVGLCFANEVKSGPIGVVGASGTGSQEVSVQIDALGSGISQLIGVGGRDLSEKIGGIMMLDGLAMLDADPDTSVIILLSKPPAPSIAERVLEEAGKTETPVVVCFIGAESPANLPENITFVSNTRDAAVAAVAAATGTKPETGVDYKLDTTAIKSGWGEKQHTIHGLFCGGTVCDEVFHALRHDLESVGSNVAKDPNLRPGAGDFKHLLIDLGDDEYTQGRPHPMIDPTLRNNEILKVGENPEVALLLLDFELGYGSHPDPVGATIESITKARATAKEDGRELTVVAYVLGTDQDPQDKETQVAKLRENGVLVVDSAVDLATVALEIIR